MKEIVFTKHEYRLPKGVYCNKFLKQKFFESNPTNYKAFLLNGKKVR